MSGVEGVVILLGGMAGLLSAGLIAFAVLKNI